jgi:hypothetical protein
VRDVNTTSFGLVIAYLLPGMVGLYSLTFWFARLHPNFTTFVTADSNVGLFLLVVIASLAVGLLVNFLRRVLFERWRSDGLKPKDFAKLGSNTAMLEAYRARIDENLRCHQFGGGMNIVPLSLYAAWLKSSWSDLNCRRVFVSLLAFTAVEVVTGVGALEAYHGY